MLSNFKNISKKKKIIDSIIYKLDEINIDSIKHLKIKDKLISQLETKLETQNKYFIELTDTSQELVKKYNDFINKKNILTDKIENYYDMNAEELANSKDDIIKFETIQRKIISELKQIVNKTVKIENERMKTDSDIKSNSELVKKLKTENKHLQDQIVLIQEANKARINELLDEIKSNINNKNNTTTSIQKLTANIEKLEEEIEHLTVENNSNNELIIKYKEQLLKIENDITVTKKLDDLNNTITENENLIEQYKHQLEEHIVLKQLYEKYIKNINEKLVILESNINIYFNKINIINENILNIKTNLSNINSDTTNIKITKRNKIINKLLDRLETEILNKTSIINKTKNLENMLYNNNISIRDIKQNIKKYKNDLLNLI